MLLGRDAAIWRKRQAVAQLGRDRQQVARPPNGGLVPDDRSLAAGCDVEPRFIRQLDLAGESPTASGFS
jgi:hypothetical protein